MKLSIKIMICLKLCLISPMFFANQQITNKHEKWIVVTTINYPTNALKKLASLNDWHLVVVADKKTPLDWHLDNCKFLSVEKQKKLNYSIIDILPWNHYARKNIGYLYAIEHGAKIIYETDDDNMLSDNTISYLKEITPIALYQADAPVVNPYAHFGQPTVWPRGYPLEYVLSKNNGDIRQSLRQIIIFIDSFIFSFYID